MIVIACSLTSIPVRAQDYWRTKYVAFSLGASLIALPAADKFYFTYLYPEAPLVVDLEDLTFNGAGIGAGFSLGAGIDLPVQGVKFLAQGMLRYGNVAATETQDYLAPNDPMPPTQVEKHYSLSTLYVGIDLAIRSKLITSSWFATGGLSVGYYMSNDFSGYFHIAHQGSQTSAQMPSGKYRTLTDVEISSQDSRYTYNPQQYALTLGLGRIFSLLTDFVLTSELNARIPLSQLFYGVTSDMYKNSGVTPSKLWSIALNFTVGVPFGSREPWERKVGQPVE